MEPPLINKDVMTKSKSKKCSQEKYQRKTLHTTIDTDDFEIDMDSIHLLVLLIDSATSIIHKITQIKRNGRQLKVNFQSGVTLEEKKEFIDLLRKTTLSNVILVENSIYLF